MILSWGDSVIAHDPPAQYLQHRQFRTLIFFKNLCLSSVLFSLHNFSSPVAEIGMEIGCNFVDPQPKIQGKILERRAMKLGRKGEKEVEEH